MDEMPNFGNNSNFNSSSFNNSFSMNDDTVEVEDNESLDGENFEEVSSDDEGMNNMGQDTENTLKISLNQKKVNFQILLQIIILKEQNLNKNY